MKDPPSASFVLVVGDWQRKFSGRRRKVLRVGYIALLPVNVWTDFWVPARSHWIIYTFHWSPRLHPADVARSLDDRRIQVLLV
jgi:hypothetical protein